MSARAERLRLAIVSALNSVQGTAHHLPQSTLTVLAERLTQDLTPIACDRADAPLHATCPTDARAAIHAMFQLDEASTAELDTRLDALVTEALVKAGVQYVDCPVCGAARPVTGECGNCAFKARMAAELAARGMVAAPEFFQPGHTYAREHHASTIRFLVKYLDDSPCGTYRVAFGWRIEDGDVTWSPSDSDDFGGWVDVTEAGPR